ncbi:MAG: 6,7-dimethyl-8-ribityllumazine synthase [Gemmatimonadales bacterium]
MAEIAGRIAAVGRVGIVVSRYHERITTRLLEGAKRCCREAGLAEDQIDVVWVPGAFELGSVATAMAETGRYVALVALGCVVRGDTPHFDYVAGESARALGRVASDRGLPVGFGLLTVDVLQQAVDRAGGSAGNKGYEAAEAALRTADAIRQLRDGAAS